MKKALLTALIAAVSTTAVHAYNFQLDITPGEKVVLGDGTTPFTGSVFIGKFDVGTDFNLSIGALDDFFDALSVSGFSGSGFPLSQAVPAGGEWEPLDLFWSDTLQQGSWDANGWNNQPFVAVFLDIAPGPNAAAPSFDGATNYLIVDTGNVFKNAAGSSLGTSFATVDTTDTVLKSNNAQVVPEPSSALLILGGLGLAALRRRRRA